MGLCLPWHTLYQYFYVFYFTGLLCIKKKDEPEEEWQAFTESLFLVVKDCFTCCHAAETKGSSNSLPNNLTTKFTDHVY